LKLVTPALPFTPETIADEEGDEQMKRRRFLIQNKYF